MNFIHLTKGYTNSLCPSELKLLKPFFAFGFLLGYKRERQEIFLLVMLAMCFFGNFSSI
jgi:hypothetical protein